MSIFNHYLNQWCLVPDGDSIITHSSQLLPVIYKNSNAMLKIAISEEEHRGALLMTFWNGKGAARVYEHEGDALLMERATGVRSLVNMTKTGKDDEASEIICEVIAKLHNNNQKPFPESLISLPIWFQSLHLAAKKQGGIFIQASLIAEELLKIPQDTVVLHGDIHHQNILDFSAHGWLAIDPKGLIGERGFDYANIFCNPDFEVATTPGRLAHQATVIAKNARLERTRLIKWIFAYAGLSAAWSLEDGNSPDLALAIAHLAKAEMT